MQDADIGAVGKLGDVCPFKLDNGFFDLGFSQLFSLVQSVERLFCFNLTRSVFLKNYSAEEEGFEPPVRVIARTADFESAPFVHSGTPPMISYPNNLLPFSLAELAELFQLGLLALLVGLV